MRHIFTLLTLLFSLCNYAQGVVCPPDTAVSCCEDYNDLMVTGNPSVINPSFSHFTKEDIIDIDECRVGSIIRTWTGHKASGRFSCVQRIKMVRRNPFDGDITWPQDWIGECSDEIPYVEPQYNIGFCDQIGHTFNDDTFRFIDNSCIKILRNWKVIDWCIYKSNTGEQNGVWGYTQVLMVIDHTKPQMSECNDKVIVALNDGCSASFDLQKSASDVSCNPNYDLNWEFKIDFHNDSNIDTVGIIKGDSITLSVKDAPVGTHMVIWKVYDGCANVQSCVENITVKDGKAPTLICYLSTTENLVQVDDSLRFPAKEFVKYAEDNCTDKEDLIFSYSPSPKDSVKVFTCWDIGFQFLRIFAIDKSGLSDFAYVLTRVNVNGPCSNYPLVSGLITNMNNHPIKDIHISILGDDREYLIEKTDTTGRFSFPYQQSEVEAKLNFIVGRNYVENVTEKDAQYIVDYLLGKVKMNKYQKWSADLNNDNRVTIEDVKKIRELLSGKIDYEDIGNKAKFYIVSKDNSGDFVEIKEAIKLDIADYNIKCLLKGNVIDN